MTRQPRAGCLSLKLISVSFTTGFLDLGIISSSVIFKFSVFQEFPLNLTFAVKFFYLLSKLLLRTSLPNDPRPELFKARCVLLENKQEINVRVD